MCDHRAWNWGAVLSEGRMLQVTVLLSLEFNDVPSVCTAGLGHPALLVSVLLLSPGLAS